MSRKDARPSLLRSTGVVGLPEVRRNRSPAEKPAPILELATIVSMWG